MADWQDYPLSLSSELCNPYLFHTKYSEKLLSANSKRLFVPNDQIHIKVIEVGVKDYIFTDFASLDEYLSLPEFKGTRIFLVPQGFSWDQLKISEDSIKRLFHSIGAFPLALDVLCAFGEQTSATNDSLGCCHSYSKGHIKEYTYLAKTVEEHGREDADEPWSIRQMGVYHGRNTESICNTFVIFNPTRSFQQRFKDAQAQTGLIPSPQDIHLLLLSHSTWQWRWYLSYWETELGKLISKAHLSQVERTKDTEVKPRLTTEYTDVQNVQVIRDRLNMAKFILGSNLRICDCFSDIDMELFRRELDMQSKRADNLLERTKSASGLMQDIISFGGLDALRISSENSNEMARLAEIDNKNMVNLTAKSQKDGQTLKKITILTMVYLPASLVSQFLSMGYLKVNSSRYPASLNFANEMWIFAVLTISLLALTLALWLFIDSSRNWRGWWRRRTVSPDQAADKKV